MDDILTTESTLRDINSRLEAILMGGQSDDTLKELARTAVNLSILGTVSLPRIKDILFESTNKGEIIKCKDIEALYNMAVLRLDFLSK